MSIVHHMSAAYSLGERLNSVVETLLSNGVYMVDDCAVLSDEQIVDWEISPSIVNQIRRFAVQA